MLKLHERSQMPDEEARSEKRLRSMHPQLAIPSAGPQVRSRCCKTQTSELVLCCGRPSHTFCQRTALDTIFPFHSASSPVPMCAPQVCLQIDHNVPVQVLGSTKEAVASDLCQERASITPLASAALMRVLLASTRWNNKVRQ